MQSHDDSQIFANEDLSKAENRVNVALFGLLPQDWFREWFLEKLNLPLDSILYPPTNEGEVRPDLKVEALDSSTIAWIEVELGTDSEQISRYGNQLPEPVKAVWGKRGSGGDLSLEEISEFLSESADSQSPQTQVNVRHLKKLIDDGLRGHSQSQKRSEVPEKMLAHPFVVSMTELLGDKLKYTTGRINPGELKADAIKEDGFTLRAFSPVSTTRTVFLLNIEGGSQQIKFPNKAWLERFIPSRQAEIEEYTAFLSRMDFNIDTGKTNVYATGSLHVDVVLPHLEELARCVRALAAPN